MFTPPASPAPPRTLRNPSPSPSASEDDDVSQQYLTVPRASSPTPLPKRSSSLTSQAHLQLALRSQAKTQYEASVAAKRRFARHARWSILLVPAVLVLIALSTHYLSHPGILDIFSMDHHPDSWETWSATLVDLKPHKRHASPDPDGQITAASVEPTASSLVLQSGTLSDATSQSQSQSSTTPASSTSGSSADSGAGSSSSTPVASQTIPAMPTTPPTLPTPFPQPFDETMTNNYSTVACQNFMANMTQQQSFRSCRPFSLLLQNSDAFIEQAQNNLTALNAIVWGTCNTNTDAPTCVANMAWFEENIQTQCESDLKAGNAIVQSTLTGLQAYPLMRQVACLSDQSTDAYCYVEAVHNSNPSDLYFYNLPLGTGLPAKATPSCSACTKSVMALYAEDGTNLTALNEVYNGAATVANQACGAGYVQITAVSHAARGVVGSVWTVSGIAVLLVAMSLC